MKKIIRSVLLLVLSLTVLLIPALAADWPQFWEIRGRREYPTATARSAAQI